MQNRQVVHGQLLWQHLCAACRTVQLQTTPLYHASLAHFHAYATTAITVRAEIVHTDPCGLHQQQLADSEHACQVACP